MKAGVKWSVFLIGVRHDLYGWLACLGPFSVWSGTNRLSFGITDARPQERFPLIKQEDRSIWMSYEPTSLLFGAIWSRRAPRGTINLFYGPLRTFYVMGSHRNFVPSFPLLQPWKRNRV